MTTTQAMRSRRRVCVVGAGVIGLASAVNIVENIPGVAVTVVAEKFSSPDITSCVSGGLWHGRDSIGGTPRDRLIKWSRETWNHNIALMKTPEGSKAGIQFIHVYRMCPQTVTPDIPESHWWKDDVFGYHMMAPYQVERLFPGYKGAFSYLSTITDTTLYLPYLLNRFRTKGGQLVERRLGSLAVLAGEYDVVVNCSGIGAKMLANDKHVQPVRGQILRVRAPMQTFCMLEEYSKHAKRDVEADNYVLVRNGEVILGGTRQVNRWDTTPNKEDSEKIMRKTVRLFPNLKDCEVLEEKVGLRPSRPIGVRLEAETMRFGSQELKVVHNYGHDGNGVTTHWGCGQEAAEIVRGILASSPWQPQSKL
ncbi:D-aspartate oxidase-like [Diadema antillarum]|uniref:D-aspartate oxidase-like n=1 Tax=Diadema antillarum TaxID=105358 RepID=UPI003A89B690